MISFIIINLIKISFNNQNINYEYKLLICIKLALLIKYQIIFKIFIKS